MSIEFQGQGQTKRKEIDLKRLFSVFTVDIISTCCFSMDLKDFRDPESEMLISARKFFNVSRLKMAFYMAVPKPLLALSGFDINDNSSIEFFARFAQEVINTRRKYAADKNSLTKKQEDFLQILIDAAAEHNRDRNTQTAEEAAATTATTPTTTTTTDQQDVQNDNNNDEQLVVVGDKQQQVSYMLMLIRYGSMQSQTVLRLIVSSNCRAWSTDNTYSPLTIALPNNCGCI